MSVSSLEVELPIAANHAAFAGHFPGDPVVPGVVLLDETLHAIERHQPPSRGRWQIEGAKFHSIVGPGEIVTLRYQQATNAVFRFTLHVQQRLVASGVLSVSA